jgi:hypothetical protein
MNKLTHLATAMVLTVSLPAFAAGTATESATSPQHKAAVEKCEKKAKDHHISQEKMKSYLNTCETKEMSKTQTHTGTPPKE